ncbi:ComEC/Rec2 family competence protein [Intestinibacillus sp. Marseille-P6563]|uniref:ComEC/Rec2 family competence protein n=1 Tax=Intestinibacillus sp. Marseille-P6563 TaxID=2364792 RepID=UPI0013DF5651|nr:MBL fold metallo-hydrolase [Intestinibacillus sp. Marseille-P6563]
MQLYFLHVGYGEAMVLLDDGHCLVIDGGPGRGDEAYTHPGTIHLADFLAQQGVSHIDVMLCTHLHNDHLSGLVDVAERFSIGEFWVNCWPQESAARAIEAALPECPDDLSLRLFTTGLQHLERLRPLLSGAHIRERAATADFEELWPGCRIRLFGMEEAQIAQRRAQFEAFCRMEDPAAQRDAMRAFDKVENTCSLACSLEVDGWTAMLTGDLCSGWDERCAAPHFPKGQLLKLTHHGQRDGMPQSLVDASDPEVFLMCADTARTFRSACDEVQARAAAYLTERGRPVQVYTTGLLAESFGLQDGQPPCALCCQPGQPTRCTPYYAKEAASHGSV